MRGSGAGQLAAPPGRSLRYLPHSRKLQTCSSRRSTIWKASRRICCCASSACEHRAATASDPARPTRPPSAQPPAPHQVPVETDEPWLAVVVEHQDGVDHPGGCTTRPEPEPGRCSLITPPRPRPQEAPRPPRKRGGAPGPHGLCSPPRRQGAPQPRRAGTGRGGAARRDARAHTRARPGDVNGCARTPGAAS